MTKTVSTSKKPRKQHSPEFRSEALKLAERIGVTAAARELSLMFFNKDILHFRRFAKYVAAFWRIASSSSRSASWRLRRAISVDISSSRSEDVC